MNATEVPAAPVHLTARALLTFVLLGLVMWAAYFAIGSRLQAHGLTQWNDLVFNSDTRRILEDICEYGGSHKRSNVHPLFVLFVNPIGLALNHVTGSIFTTGVLITAFTGGLAIALAGAFFYRLGLRLQTALLLALLLGCSTAHLFFGSSPETFALSALTIITVFHVALGWPGRLLPGVAAGVFTFGVLVTNLAIGTLAFGASALTGSHWARALGRTLLYIACVLIVAAGLNYVQKLIWPRTRPFYIVKTYLAEERFMDKPKTLMDRVDRELRLLRHVFAYDWFAPEMRLQRPMTLKSDSLGAIPGVGKVALLLWAALLAAATWTIFKSRLYARPICLGAALCLLFNLVLHTLYGDDLFLYACNTSFLVLTLAALAIADWRLAGWKRPAFEGALALLFVLEVANNQQFVAALFSIHIDAATGLRIVP